MDKLTEIKAEVVRRGMRMKDLARALDLPVNRLAQYVGGFQNPPEGFESECRQVFRAWDGEGPAPALTKASLQELNHTPQDRIGHPLVRVETVAALLGVDVATIENACKDSKLIAVRHTDFQGHTVGFVHTVNPWFMRYAEEVRQQQQKNGSGGRK